MADAATDDNDFGKELEAAFAEDAAAQTPAAPVEEPKPGDPTPPAPEAPKVEEPKPNEPATPEVPKPGEEPGAAPADPTKKPEDGAAAPEAPKAPGAPEEPAAAQPLTKDDVTSIIQNLRNEERTSGQAVETTTKDVLDAYYPEGLSNTLVDQASGKELKTPQDVVDASGGNMSIEDATQWLMNEQFKLDQNITKIKDDARNIAETTINFRNDSIAALHKYEPLFKAYPQLQTKAFNLLMKQVKADEKKGVILVAPDVMDLYDTYLEPYQKAYEFSTQQPATNQTPAPGAPAAPPATPGVDDRLDEGADGGANTEVDDPNDFAQQVKKELANPF